MRCWIVVFAVVSALSVVYCDEEKETPTAAVRWSVSVPALRGAAGALSAALLLPADQRAPLPHCLAPDYRDCYIQTLRCLNNGTAQIAVVALPVMSQGGKQVPAAVELQIDHIEELGDLTPPTRRACLASLPPARSLLDLVDQPLAKTYHVPDSELEYLLPSTCEYPNCSKTVLTPDWCVNDTCATLLTSQEEEARILLKEVQTNRLYATVLALGDQLTYVAKALATRPLVACDWALDLTPLIDISGTILGPPPCLDAQPCPFESRRIVKLVKRTAFLRAQSFYEEVVGLHIPKKRFKTLVQEAVIKGPEKAAEDFYSNQTKQSIDREIRLAVLIPKSTNRQAFNSQALIAAAILAEVDLKRELPTNVDFKIETFNDKCHTAAAQQYMSNAVSTKDFRKLTAIAGPACGSLWADMVARTRSYHLPILAYTPQAPASVPAGNEESRLQLLAGGDGRQAASALSSLLARFGWRRAAALSEPATRPLLDAVRLQAKLDLHVEVPDAGYNVTVDLGIVHNWISRAAADNSKIFYLCVEEDRLRRSALCAARELGLTPDNGAVWLLCPPHSSDWIQPSHGENCTIEQIYEVAQGHFTVISDWASRWLNDTKNPSDERKAWEGRWRNFVIDSTLEEELTPDPYAALLYDTIRQWALALYRLHADNPRVVDDLHDINFVRNLIENTTRSEFNGLTGPFKWNLADGAYTRNSSLVILQWNSKSGAQKIGTWDKGNLEMNVSAIRWYTTDGTIPNDGSETCGIQKLADALHTDCKTAFLALGALLIAILVGGLAATALYCRRRAEKEYRKHLQALGMRPLPLKPAGHDRWEIPRERVVINRKLGTGAFGTVYGGHALLAEDRGWSAVAVKTLKAGASTEEKLDFLSEAEAMKRFDHKNVVRLLGIVTKTEPVCTVMEFMLYGDLKNYLLARRHLAMGCGEEEAEGQEADEASPRRLTGMALDVARALSYLAQLRYVHRDVAARNCLVSARRVVKLADFGMTRLVFENDYYRFSRKGMLPVRWMAPESLALGVFSPASDVWSFGVLLYEIVTFGSLPFQGLSNSEVLAHVKGGRTLDMPSGLRPQLEGLIKSCWQQDPKSRPSASEVAAFLADAPRLLLPCLDVPLDALPLDGDPPWRLPRDQAEARWVSWAAPASATTDTTYLSTEGALPLDTDTFLP